MLDSCDFSCIMQETLQYKLVFPTFTDNPMLQRSREMFLQWNVAVFHVYRKDVVERAENNASDYIRQQQYHEV